MPTDTSEKGLESLIITALVGSGGTLNPIPGGTGEDGPSWEGSGYIQGDPKDYDREHAVDLAKLLEFLKTTQPNAFEALGLREDGPRR